MNHSYRLVWNDATQRYIPVPETARGCGKSHTALKLAPVALLLGALLTFQAGAQNLPAGETQVSGATVHRNGHQMTIDQTSDKAILHWQSFDIGRGASVHFNQENASDIALNRVMGGSRSQIDGKLSANGQVWLVNPAGVVFGRGSQVNVGGLVASTLDITNEDFKAGRQVFARGAAQGGITNHGDITVADGSLLALLAPHVSNQGVLSARLGNVVLAGGDQVTLQAGAGGRLEVAADPATVNTLIENRQMIMADGGQVVMTSSAADALAASVVSNTGTVQARTLQNQEGRILLLADMQRGTVAHGGLLDASAPDGGAPHGGNGGFVGTSAAQVTLTNGHQVTTAAPLGQAGNWLIDSSDYTIAAEGGDISGAQLSTDLATSNITIETTKHGTAGGNGDIHVNDAVSWSANRLTLNAERNITVNATMAVKGDATLHLNHGGTQGDAGRSPAAGSNLNVEPGIGQVDFQKAGAGLLAINGHGHEVIKSVVALQHIADEDRLDGRYALGGSLSFDGYPFTPIGATSNNAFTGSFDGLGHTIQGLEIDLPENHAVGLFGHATNATLRNVKLEGVDVKGNFHVGALVGAQGADGGKAHISNVHVADAQVRGEEYVGGLVGENTARNGGVASISNAHFQGRVTSESSAGGLAGANRSMDGGKARIDNASSHSAVVGTGEGGVGGLVGFNDSHDTSSISSISDAHATGPVLGKFRTGGLVGANEAVRGGRVRIFDAHAEGQVWGGDHSGGLVGENGATGGGTSQIGNAYATGNVSGKEGVGGLVGSHRNHGGKSSISRSYAEGDVSGTTGVGGLAGITHATATITEGYAVGTAKGKAFVGPQVGRCTGDDAADSVASVMGD